MSQSYNPNAIYPGGVMVYASMPEEPAIIRSYNNFENPRWPFITSVSHIMPTMRKWLETNLGPEGTLLDTKEGREALWSIVKPSEGHGDTVGVGFRDDEDRTMFVLRFANSVEAL